MFNKYSNNSRFPKPLIILFFVSMAALFITVLGFVIMFLWNEILVEVTNVKTISFWQAIGLFALTRILFGGFKSGHRKKHWGKKRRNNMRDKLMNMSPEERAMFKDNWKNYCKTKD